MGEIILCTAGFFAVLGYLTLRVRVGSIFYKGVKRCVYAVWGLYILSLIPGLRAGVNALDVGLVAALGVPGAVLVQVIALMP